MGAILSCSILDSARASVQGGLGHLDMGYGYAVGADNYSAQPNATTLVKFDDTMLVAP